MKVSGPGECEVLQSNIEGLFQVSEHKFDVKPIRIGRVFFSRYVWMQRCWTGRELVLTEVHVLSRE